jgi:hypothetical protein
VENLVKTVKKIVLVKKMELAIQLMGSVYVTRAIWEPAVKRSAIIFMLERTAQYIVNATMENVITTGNAIVFRDILVKNVIIYVLLEHLEKIVRKIVHVIKVLAIQLMENVIVILDTKEKNVQKNAKTDTLAVIVSRNVNVKITRLVIMKEDSVLALLDIQV